MCGCLKGYSTLMAGLREKHKDQRRRAIIEAAASLLREKGLDGLSIPEIAARADVSPATVYNLVGGQNALAGAVLAVVADTIEIGHASTMSADPLEACIGLGEQVLDVFEARETEIRPILQLYLMRRGTPEWNAERPLKAMAERAVGLYGRLLQEAQGKALFDAALSPVVVGETLYATLKLRIDHWASGLIELHEARSAARKSAHVVLLSGATVKARQRLLASLGEIDKT
jgi:AcrR family transcriptional regulator